MEGEGGVIISDVSICVQYWCPQPVSAVACSGHTTDDGSVLYSAIVLLCVYFVYVALLSVCVLYSGYVS